MYQCIIKNHSKQVESASTRETVAECAAWFAEHEIGFYDNKMITRTMYKDGNTITRFVFCPSK